MTVNVNAPNGFQFFGKMEGAAPTVGTTIRKITSSSAVGFGDPVVSLGTGYIDIAAAGTTQIAGIFYGCEYFNSAVGKKVWSPNWPGSASATGAGTAYIDSDPNSLYQAQSNNTAILFSDINANINFVIGTPATTAAGGFSTSALDQSTINTTNTLPFRIVGLLSDYDTANSAPGTDDASAYNRVIVRANYWDRTSLVGIV